MHLPNLTTPPWDIAAPSFVVRGNAAENCLFLEGRVAEVGLVLFESEACLAYTDEDLPPALADLDLAYHVHLPLDLPWIDGARAVWEVAGKLAAMTDYLAPWAYVLHPPPAAFGPDAVRLMREFAALWTGAGLAARDLLLENTREQDLSDLLPLAAERGLGLCLDIGHVMAYGQYSLLGPRVAGLASVRMLHLYGGETRKGHQPFAALDRAGTDALLRLVDLAPTDARMMLEIFDWQALADSAAWLARVAQARAKA